MTRISHGSRHRAGAARAKYSLHFVDLVGKTTRVFAADNEDIARAIAIGLIKTTIAQVGGKGIRYVFSRLTPKAPGEEVPVRVHL